MSRLKNQATVNIFAKYLPIFTILSLLHSARNFQQNYLQRFRHAFKPRSDTPIYRPICRSDLSADISVAADYVGRHLGRHFSPTFFGCQSRPIHLHTAVNIQHCGWRRNCCCLYVDDVLCYYCSNHVLRERQRKRRCRKQCIKPAVDKISEHHLILRITYLDHNPVA